MCCFARFLGTSIQARQSSKREVKRFSSCADRCKIAGVQLVDSRLYVCLANIHDYLAVVVVVVTIRMVVVEKVLCRF